MSTLYINDMWHINDIHCYADDSTSDALYIGWANIECVIHLQIWHLDRNVRTLFLAQDVENDIPAEHVD